MKKYLCLLPLFLASCSSMYIPSMSNVPLFNEKGDAQIELSASTNSMQLSADYAFSDNYALLFNTNMSYGNFSDYNDIFTRKDAHTESHEYLTIDLTTYGRYKHKYVELAAGKYDLLSHESWKLETFLGCGYGYANESPYSNSYVIPFVQADLGQHFRIFDWGGSFRFSSSFHSFKGEDDSNCSFSEHFSILHFEPMLFWRVGGEHFKFIHKFGLSYPIKSKNFSHIEKAIGDSDYYRTTLIHLSVGVHYMF